MPGPEAWRVFCAIYVPLELREKALAHSMRLRKAVPEAHASWSKPDNIHLTLKFLGDISESRVQSLSKAAANASTALDPFSIGVQGSGVFPTRGQPRVLWIGMEDLQGKLGELYRRLEDECGKAGFRKEARPFHPHLTLARLRKPSWAHELAEAHKQMQFEPVEFTVSELLVIRSELSGEGSKYTTISRHPLAQTVM
jgi:RNA 2',3'-cyclic 3'-phosphodiesterase